MYEPQPRKETTKDQGAPGKAEERQEEKDEEEEAREHGILSAIISSYEHIKDVLFAIWIPACTTLNTSKRTQRELKKIIDETIKNADLGATDPTPMDQPISKQAAVTRARPAPARSPARAPPRASPSPSARSSA